MCNTMVLSEKIKWIIDNKSNSSSHFADEIGVPRSAISHILAGRNRPSLELILKINKRYPELGVNWILDGQDITAIDGPVSVRETVEYDVQKGQKRAAGRPLDLFDQVSHDTGTVQPILKPDDKRIEKIMVFYKDGTFQEFQ